MKKLILITAIACSTIAQASYINWTVNTMSWKKQNDSYAAQGTAVWMYDNNYASSIVAALKDKTVVDFTSANWISQVSNIDGIYATGYTTNDKGMMEETTIFSENLIDFYVNEDEYTLGTLFIDTTSSSDITYYSLSKAMNNLYATDDMTSLDIVNTTLWRVQNGTGWQVAQSVPEPTSSVLLLLGIASTALRRRRI